MRIRTGAAAVALTLVAVVPATTAAARSAVPTPSLGRTAVFSVRGVAVSGTPARYDKVMVRRFGSPSARNVLVLVPGDLGGAGDFDIVGPYLARHVPDLQVWAEMRREGALEDNTVLLKTLHGKATVQQAFNYYLGWLADPGITDHYKPLTSSQDRFADSWGLAVAMGDLHNVIDKARDGGKRTVILGGHSLGGAEASIYPAWDFNGRAGYKDLAGIIGIDGDAPLAAGPDQAPEITAPQARAALAKLAASKTGPWQDLLGFGLPWITGPFAELAALGALKQPLAASIGQNFKLLPKDLKPPVRVDNQAQLGYGFDAATSPPALALIHVHSGHLAAAGSPRRWVNDGPTPIENVAFAFAQEPLGAVDWYFPERLAIDVDAASSLTQTPAASVLGLRLFHLHQVDIPLYVIQTSLGGTDNGVADAAVTYQRESRIPSVTIINRASTYGHLDPLLATPSRNAFLKTVVPWIEQLPGYRR
jgi:hypothetical protein